MDTDQLVSQFPEIGPEYVESFRSFHRAKQAVFDYGSIDKVLRDYNHTELTNWFKSFKSEELFDRMYATLVDDHITDANRKGLLRSSTKEFLHDVIKYILLQDEDCLTVFPIKVERAYYKRFVLLLPDDTRIPLNFAPY